MDSYRHYAHWRESRDLETTESKIYWKLKMDLLSLRYEAVGEPKTADILTEVIRDGQVLRYRNHQYKEGDDLIAMYQESLGGWKGYTKWRHGLEIKQTVDVWHKTSQILKTLPSGSPHETSVHLENAGFEPTKLPLSLGLRSVFPNLDSAQKISHQAARRAVLETPSTLNPEVDVYLGPPIITVSPPSSIHRQGESSFGWVSRLLYVPQIDSFAILQNGCFTGYSKTEILKFLAYQNPDYQEPASEADILGLISALPPEFTKKHSLAIVDEIVRSIGYFKTLPPIDGNIQLGTFDHDAQIKAILQIFEWEFEQCLDNPEMAKAMEQRFQQWEVAILHSTIAGFTLDPQQFFEDYRQLYENPEVALHPQKFARATTQRLLRAYPEFKVLLDLTKMDCLVGSVIRMPKKTGVEDAKKLSSNKSQKRSLERWQSQGIQNQAQLESFCTEFNLPLELFTENIDQRECPGCHQIPRFLGPCCCALCHAQDNILGMLNYIDPSVKKDNLETQLDSVTDREPNNAAWRDTVTLTQFITNDVYLN